jgi:hypothetical protein
MLTEMLSQSATETLDPPPLMEQVKFPQAVDGQGESVTVPLPTAMKENPEPYRQHPVVVNVME